MDHANRTRLKLHGRARRVGPGEDALLAPLEVADCRARVECGMVIAVEGFDWNCPQRITPHLSLDDAQRLIEPLHRRIAELGTALSARRAAPGRPCGRAPGR